MADWNKFKKSFQEFVNKNMTNYFGPHNALILLGSRDEIKIAEEAINDFVAQNQRELLKVEKRVIGKIIGKKGSVIKKLTT